MMKLLLIAGLLISVNVVFAQEPNLSTPVDVGAMTNNMENLLRALNYNTNIERTADDIEGSAYLREEFLDGRVTLENGVEYNHIPLRYNVYNDLVEFKSSNGEVYNINNPDVVEGIVIGDKIYRYLTCEVQKEEVRVLAELLFDGTVKLYKHYRMRIQPGRVAGTHTKAQPPKFVNTPSLFVVEIPGTGLEVINGKKELFAVFGDKSAQIKKFMKDRGLSVKQEADLVKIIEFVSSI